jgi:hypothetical protein
MGASVSNSHDRLSGPWIEIGWIEVDAGTVAFGDPAVLDDTFVLAPTVTLSSGALPDLQDALVIQETKADCALPVEVIQGKDGTSRAARMCFTDDVDDLQGGWREVGTLTITNEKCFASDPYCEGRGYRFEFSLPSGGYAAEVFDFVYPDGQSDVLGMRIIPGIWG